MKKVTLTSGVTKMKTDDPRLARSICAWDGCNKTTENEQLETGWRCLMVYGDTHVSIILGHPVIALDQIDPATWNRDAVLCPDHVAALESLLKPLK